MAKNDNDFSVIAAGQNPPNPVELLSSPRMNKALEKLRKTYDYVILDFPPLGEVSDAMAAADKVDGILLVVRQNYCNRLALADTVHQFEFVNAKLLGVVLNGTTESEGKYGKKYYRRYNKKYAYAAAHEKAAESKKN